MRLLRFAALIILLFTLCLISGQTQAQSSSQIKNPVAVWAAGSWSGNDRPFVAVRKKLDLELAASQDHVALLSKYADRAKAHLQDPIALFKWLYVARSTPTEQTQLIEKYDYMQPAKDAICKIAIPVAPEFVRLRFLSEFSSQDLVKVGERLEKLYPQDVEVRYHLLLMYCDYLYYHNDPLTKTKALLSTKILFEKTPNNPDYYAAYGAIFYSSWYKNKDEADKIAAIKWYKDYLRVGTPDDPFRPRAKIALNLLYGRGVTAPLDDLGNPN